LPVRANTTRALKPCDADVGNDSLSFQELTALLDVGGQTQLILDLAADDAQSNIQVETRPPASKLVDHPRADDPVVGTREAPVGLWSLNRAGQNGSVERRIGTTRAKIARWTGILFVLISKPHEGGLIRGDLLVHADVTLIAIDGGREVHDIVVGDRVRCP